MTMQPVTTQPAQPTESELNRIWRMLKPALIAFSVLLFVSLLFLKPYLPKVLYYSSAKIYDYRHFANRQVKAGAAQPWALGGSALQLKPELNQLLTDLETTAFLVVRDGKIVFEQYYGDGGEKVISGAFSASKSILGLLAGFALQDGAIPSLDVPIIQYLPEYGERVEGKITIKNLLTMSSGTNWEESGTNPLSITAEAYFGDDLYRTALKPRLMVEPGKQYSYKSGDSQLLAMVISRAAKSTIANYVSEKLWVPLGAETEAQWSLDHIDGLEKAFCCFNATARDYARIGQLVLNGGKWNGKQLLPQEYIKEMLTPHMIPNKKGEPVNYYGYQWWVMNHASGPVYYAWGLLGQYVIVRPDRQEVIVRLGKKEGKVNEHVPEIVEALVKDL